MAAVILVADDLTGACAAAARYAARGLRAVTLASTEQLGERAGRFDVLAASTDSRHVPGAEAAARVRSVLDRAPAAPLVVKRIDTTLRGNVGAEVDAALDVVAARAGGVVRGLVVPAFPAAGRTTVGGLQLVVGRPLGETDAAHDPLSPVRSSRVAELVAAQSDRTAAEVPLDVVSAGGPALVEALHADADLLVCDAVTDAHLRAIAAAAAAVGAVRWVSVDPGPFGVELAAALRLTEPPDAPAALVVAGSVTPLTRAQLALAGSELGVAFVEADVTALDADGLADELSDRLSRRRGRFVGLRTAARGDDVAALDTAAAAAVSSTLGEVTARVLGAGGVGGLYLTGGEVVAGVLRALGAAGLEVEGEVLPLAVSGRLVGGPHGGLPIVTKGGLIGDEGAAIACLEHLWGRIRARGVHTEGQPP